MPENDQDRIFNFYQGDEGEPGVQPFSFRIATTKPTVGHSSARVPKKLGDGNFGMVFEAPSTNAQFGTFALKILYQHRALGPSDRTEDASRDLSRILEELHIGVTLPLLLKPISEHPEIGEVDPNFPKDGKGQSEWLVLPLAYSEKLEDFVGKAELEKQDIKFSRYAYIMEKFDYSLKDLMEETVGDNIGGYGRLRRANLNQRECSAIPLLDQMSRGLQVLHAAGLRHQDIKPANIYLKKRGADLVLRLGDLGFLRPHDPTLGGTAAASPDTIGIGTKHYRSIEQIDFNDAAECSVEVDEMAGVATLTSRDPKFAHTIMRGGDLAFFSKSSSHRLMRIESLEKDPAAGLVTVRVAHKVPPGKDETSDRQEQDPLVPDDKTQVTFFKNPSAKTDLFGLGSILYDMLTVGDSPERFYELLRRYDQAAVDIQTRILDRYPTYIAGTLEDPDLSAIFSRVNARSLRGQTVHAEVLRLLLRCMMSDSPGSFYADFGFAEAERARDDTENVDARLAAVGAWAKVIKEIQKVGRAIGADEFVRHHINILTNTGDDNGARPEPPLDGDNWRLGLTKVLDAYLNGEAPAEYTGQGAAPLSAEKTSVTAARAYRWIMGGLLVSRIAAWTDRYLMERPGSLRSLSQEHVSVGSYDITAWRDVVTDAEEMMVRRLRTRDPLLTRIRPFASRFEPIWWRHGTRRIRLREVVPGGPAETDAANPVSTSTEGTYIVEYDFFDFAFAANTVERNDFILAADSANSVVFRVEGVESESRLIVRLCEDEEPAGGATPEERSRKLRSLEDAYLIKTPNAVDYYGGMLSIYLYHFLISYGAGQGVRIGDFPAAVYAAIRDFPVRFRKRPSEAQEETDRPTWERLKVQTLRLVVWLSLGGFSFDDNGTRVEEESRRWGKVNDELNKWFAALKEFAVKPGASVDNWNLLTTRKDDAPFKDYVVEEFQEIKASEWRRICELYVGAAFGPDDSGQSDGDRGKTWWHRIFGTPGN